MRKAVLIINWITVAFLIYTTFTIDPTTPDAGYQYLGLLLLMPAFTISLVYAHSNAQEDEE